MKRRGISLLEVLLALTILGGSMAAISGLVSLGAKAAVRSREETTAQMLADAKLAEITTGVILPEPGGPWQFEMQENAGWVYYVDLETLPQPGLSQVIVTVAQDPLLYPKPISFSLVRWIQDPGLEIAEPEMPDEAGGTSNTTPSSTPMSGTGGTSGM